MISGVFYGNLITQFSTTDPRPHTGDGAQVTFSHDSDSDSGSDSGCDCGRDCHSGRDFVRRFPIQCLLTLYFSEEYCVSCCLLAFCIQHSMCVSKAAASREPTPLPPWAPAKHGPQASFTRTFVSPEHFSHYMLIYAYAHRGARAQ